MLLDPRRSEKMSLPRATLATATTLERSPHEDAPDRVGAGVGSRAPGTAGEGEGVDPRPGRPGRRAPADAMAGRGQGVRDRGAPRQGEPARPVRWPPSVDPLPRLLRARGHHLRRGRLLSRAGG